MRLTVEYMPGAQHFTSGSNQIKYRMPQEHICNLFNSNVCFRTVLAKMTLGV